MIDRKVDHIKQIDRTRYRHRCERIHLILALTQVDQAIRLGGELVCNDQAGSILSDVVITLQSDRPCILVRGQLEIQSQLTIRVKFDVLPHAIGNHSRKVGCYTSSGADVIDREVVSIQEVDRTRCR